MSDIVWHESAVKKEDRRNKNGHGSFILWFTGLSASGKSSVANARPIDCSKKESKCMYSMGTMSATD